MHTTKSVALRVLSAALIALALAPGLVCAEEIADETATTGETVARVSAGYPDLTVGSPVGASSEGEEWVARFTAPEGGTYLFSVAADDEMSGALYGDEELEDCITSGYLSDENDYISCDLDAGETVFFSVYYWEESFSCTARVDLLDTRNLAYGSIQLGRYTLALSRPTDTCEPIVWDASDKELKEGVDYRLAYFAYDEDDNATPLNAYPTQAGDYGVRAVALDNGEYTGMTFVERFSIVDDFDLTQAHCDLYDDSFIATGSPVEPATTVEGAAYRQLTKDVDYVLAYYLESTGGNPLTQAPADPGTYYVCAVPAPGTSFFGETERKAFTIKSDKDLAAGRFWTASYAYPYTGQPVDVQALAWDANDNQLTLGVDYELVFFEYHSDEGWVELDEAPVEIGENYHVLARALPDSGYTGETDYDVFDICSNKDLKFATVTLGNSRPVYTGEPIDLAVTVRDYAGNQLVEGRDYYLSYVSFSGPEHMSDFIEGQPVDCGDYSVIAMALDDSDYTGQTKEGMGLFTVSRSNSLQRANLSLTETQLSYTGSPVELQAKVVFQGGIVLLEGEDYILQYGEMPEDEWEEITWSKQAPTEPGRYYVRAVGGPNGAYVGSTSQDEFEILMGEPIPSIEDAAFIESGHTLAFTGSANIPQVTVADSGNNPFVAGKDYELVYYRYDEDDNPTKLAEGTLPTEVGRYAVQAVALTGSGLRGRSNLMDFSIVAANDLALATVSIANDPIVVGGSHAPQAPQVSVVMGATELVEGKHFTVSWSVVGEEGTLPEPPTAPNESGNLYSAVITALPNGGYVGENRVETYIYAPNSLGAATVTLDHTAYPYTGDDIVPQVHVVSYEGDELKQGVDYRLDYAEGWRAGYIAYLPREVGRYWVHVIAMEDGAYIDSQSVPFEIMDPSHFTDLSTAVVSTEAPSYTYTGEALTPSPVVTLDGTALTEGKDYAVSYADNTDVGTATVTVTGIGQYLGLASGTFEITKLVNPLTAKAEKDSLSVTFSSSKALSTAANVTVDGAQGTLSYDNVSSDTTAQTFIVDKTNGTVSVPKGTKAGTYIVEIKVTATPDTSSQYLPGSKTVSYKIVVAKAANPLTAKATKGSLSVTYSASRALTTAKNVTASGAQGTLSYANASSDTTAKKFTVNKAKGTVSVPKGTKAGTYVVKVSITATPATSGMSANYLKGSKTVSYKIVVAKAANPTKIKATVKTASLKTLKTKAVVVAPLTVSNNLGKGKLTCTKVSGSNVLTVNKTSGKLTVKKGTKKGTYSAKIKVTVAGTTNYKALTKTVTVKVVVK